MRKQAGVMPSHDTDARTGTDSERRLLRLGLVFLFGLENGNEAEVPVLAGRAKPQHRGTMSDYPTNIGRQHSPKTVEPLGDAPARVMFGPHDAVYWDGQSWRREKPDRARQAGKVILGILVIVIGLLVGAVSLLLWGLEGDVDTGLAILMVLALATVMGGLVLCTTPARLPIRPPRPKRSNRKAWKPVG